ncbi:MAG TPA: hypothetical protein VKS20_13685 [Candidatus Acidoferrales bacterium]|nr:hypothetical protein [Candidatus Acidoferrales bacterium]
MRRNDQLEDRQAELGEILDALSRMEQALARAKSADFQERVRGLLALGALEHNLNGIAEHCQSQDHQAESSFRDDLNGAENLCMTSEHAEIERLLRHFREELESATADAAATISLSGKELTRQIRAHVRNERKMLERLEAPEPVTEEILLRYTESPD